jgi:hypothetical protein
VTLASRVIARAIRLSVAEYCCTSPITSVQAPAPYLKSLRDEASQRVAGGAYSYRCNAPDERLLFCLSLSYRQASHVASKSGQFVCGSVSYGIDTGNMRITVASVVPQTPFDSRDYILGTNLKPIQTKTSDNTINLCSCAHGTGRSDVVAEWRFLRA